MWSYSWLISLSACGIIKKKRLSDPCIIVFFLHANLGNRVNQRMMYFPKCITTLLAGSMEKLIQFLNADFALFCNKKQFLLNYSCKLFFPKRCLNEYSVFFLRILAVDWFFPVDCLDLFLSLILSFDSEPRKALSEACLEK